YAFEQKLLQSQLPARPWFTSDLPRVFDRVVLDLDVQGELFVEELSRDLGRSLRPVGFEQDLETASLTRWESFNSYASWWKTTRDLSGLIVLSAELLERRDFFSIFEKSLRRVWSQSRFETGSS
ncbi:MAG: hypothetical protein WCH11_05600, partial [Bdellovibrio sp.]